MCLIPRILERRDELLQGLGCVSHVPSLPWDGSRSLEPVPACAPSLSIKDVVWADDIATPKQCRHVTELPVAVRHEATALTEAFFEFGFRLSYGDHKTAALVTACGAGSRSVRRALFGNAQRKGKLPILLEHLPALDLPMPPRYKHLGVQQMPSGSLWEEVRYRVAQARAAFAEARRKVFRPRAIPLQRKAMILSSNVLSKLLLGAGSWPPLTGREYKLYSGTLWSLYRSVLGVKFAEDQCICASTCFSLLQLPDPQVSLSCARLSYLAQLLRAGPDPLWAAIRADEAYLCLLKADLDWVYAWSHATSNWPNPRHDAQFWLTMITQAPGRFKGLCKRARALSVHQHTVRAALDGLPRTLCLSTGTSTRPGDTTRPEVHPEICLAGVVSPLWCRGQAMLLANTGTAQRRTCFPVTVLAEAAAQRTPRSTGFVAIW